MQLDNLEEGYTIICKSFAEYQATISMLIALDYGISCEPDSHIITILTLPREVGE